MVNSLQIRQKQNGETIRIDPESWQLYDDHIPIGTPVSKRPFLIEKEEQTCSRCHESYSERLDLPYWQRYVPVAIVGHGKNRKLFFKSVEIEDILKIEKADILRSNLSLNPDQFAVENGRKTRQLLQRGVENYLDLFSSRQLLYLDSSIRHLQELPELARLNLGMLVSTSLEFNTLLCGYKGKGKRRSGAIRHAFAHHAYAFPYTALENNPVYPRKSSGGLQKLFQSRIRNGRIWAKAPRERIFDGGDINFKTINGEQDLSRELKRPPKTADAVDGGFWLYQGSAINLPLPNNFADAVVTDPPYYDSVQYSDLSAFFRVWLESLLPEAAEWRFDVRESAVDPHKLDRESRYRELMTDIFQECYRVLNKENGRLIFTFHHWNPKAWIALSSALKMANFTLVNRYVVFSENPISVHINKMRALMHDVILVLAPVDVGINREWEKPGLVDLSDSEQFCKDCGTILGWVLNQDLDDDELAKLWKESLRTEK